jgi:hypothetical protein
VRVDSWHVNVGVVSAVSRVALCCVSCRVAVHVQARELWIEGASVVSAYLIGRVYYFGGAEVMTARLLT